MKGAPLADLLLQSAGQFPKRQAIVMPNVSLNYAELLDRSARVAAGLHALGISERAHIGILANNSEELVTALFGTWMSNCVAVPINARNKVSELRHVVADADLAAILTTSRDTSHVDFAELLTQAFPTISSQIDVSALEIADAVELRAIIQLAGSERPGLVSATRFFDAARLISDSIVERRTHACRTGDLAAILYTSGTTSMPKGCMLSHGALTVGTCERARGPLRSQAHDVTWVGGPLFHIGSLGPFIGSIGTAGTLLADVVFDADRALNLMEQEGVTVAWPWFPALIEPILDHPRFSAERLPRLAKAMMIAPEPLMKRAQQALPKVQFLQACGMTETAGIFALSDATDTVEDKAVYQGVEVDGIDTRIIDPDTGQDAPHGDIGEILVRGYCVMEGYYKSPSKTAEALEEGWLHTGDLYRRGRGGRLQFCGRLKDMLKVGGENVAAVEIEAFLMTHSAIRTAQVIPIPDARMDEVPVAFVELFPGHTLSEADIVEFCQGKIASFKIPRGLRLIQPGGWPMSLTKVDKRALKTMWDKTVA